MTKRPGSTVDETEDPNATAVATATETPDDDPKGTVDQATDAPDLDAEPTKGEQPKTPVVDKTKAEPAAKDPESPIQKAIAHLASDKPATAPSTAEDKPAAKAPTTPSPEKAGTDATVTATPGDVFAEWTKEERKHTKGTVKTKFAEMSKKVQQYEEQLKGHDPDLVEMGKSWDALLEKHQLDDDVNALTQEQVAWTIKSQAAVVRTMQAVARGISPAANDLKILDTVRAGLQEVDKHLGREPAKAAPDVDLEKLEQMATKAGETLDFDALLAFIKEAKAAKGTKAPPAVVPPAVLKQPAVDPTTGRAPATEAPAMDYEREMYANRFRSELAKHGVTDPKQVVPWFNKNVLPGLDRLLRRDFPGQKPEVVYPRLTPQTKHELHMESLRLWDAEKKKSTTPPPRQPTKPGDGPIRSQGTGSGGSNSAVGPVQAAINRMASDR